MSCILGIEQSCDECRMCIPGVKKQTNADRIRSMTDEELVDFFGKLIDFDKRHKPSKEGYLSMLQQEVEE